MAYNRINWENAPSTATPLDADNLNRMDAKIADLDTSMDAVQEGYDEMSNEMDLVNARMDTFTNLPEGSTTGDAELADARLGADGVTYNTLGQAIRTQFTNLKPDSVPTSGSTKPVQSGGTYTAIQNVLSAIAPVFSSSTSYAVGDYCTYNNALYRAKSTVPSGNDFITRYWTEIGSFSAFAKELCNFITDTEVVLGQQYNNGTILIYDGIIYEAIDDGVPFNGVGSSGWTALHLDDFIARMQSNVAEQYTRKTYSAGEYCIQRGVLYKANTDISTAEAFTASHWDQISVTEALDEAVTDLKADLSDIYDTTITLSPTGDAVTYTANEDGGYWRFINGAWQKVKTSGVAYFHMVTYPVEGGKRYRVTGRHTAYCPLCTFWTDDGTTPIGYSQDGYPSDRSSENVTLDVVVPAEATKMIVTAFPLSSFPTVYELELEDTGVVYTDAYINRVKFLKTTGFHVWDRAAQPFKYTREGTVVKVTFGYQFYVSGTISDWVKSITLNSDATYTKTVSLNSGQHLVYNPATNDVEAKSWADMVALTGSRNDYVFLGTNINGHLIGPISAIEMRDLSDRIDAVAYPLPYYYDSYMAGKVTEIEEACAFSNGVAFPFITDIHLQRNAKQSGKLIKYLGEHTNAVPFVVSGGDIPYATDTEENVLADAQKWLEYMGQWGKEKTIQVHGNHDYMCSLEGGGSFRCTVGQLHYYIADNGTFLEHPVGALYGKYDVPNQNVRIIVTDDYDTGYDGNTWTSGAEGYSSEQLAFIKSAILETSKHIIVISHQTSDATMANYIHDQSLQTMLISAKNKTGEFANWAGDIVMHLSGHSHNDEDHVEDNLLSVATVCDAAYTSPSGYTRTWGATTEQAFDVVCVDTTNKTINMIRIGAGSNREYAY